MTEIDDLLQLATRVKELREALREAEERLQAYVDRRAKPMHGARVARPPVAPRTAKAPTAAKAPSTANKNPSTKQKMANAPKAATLARLRAAVPSSTSANATGKGSVAAQVRRYMESHPKSDFNVDSLMSALKLPRSRYSAVSQSLRQLNVDGAVTRRGRGIYRWKAA